MSAWWLLVGFAVFLIGVSKSGFARLHLLPQKLERQMFVRHLRRLLLHRQHGQSAGLRTIAPVSRGHDPPKSLCPSIGFRGGDLWILAGTQLNEKLFARIIYTLTFFLGWYLLYDGIGILRCV